MSKSINTFNDKFKDRQNWNENDENEIRNSL